jgi:hypothetical protein
VSRAYPYRLLLWPPAGLWAAALALAGLAWATGERAARRQRGARTSGD